VTDSRAGGSLGVYLAFGLRLRSDLPLPELSVVPAHGAPPDVEIRLLETPLLDATTKPAGLADVADDITMLWWAGIGRFVVSDGCDICVALAPTADPAMVRLYLLGPVFNALLRQRGWIVLRAGAAKIKGRVIAVVPNPTAIDALAERGHAVIARDVIAIRAGDHITSALVQPCVPWLANRPLDDLAARRLWCDAARSDAPLTLDSLYIVSTGPIERLATAEAFAELGACLFDDLTWPGDVRRALRLMFHLASTLPVRRTDLQSLLSLADGVATRDSVRDIRG
jgi:hypothetical protein